MSNMFWRALFYTGGLTVGCAHSSPATTAQSREFQVIDVTVSRGGQLRTLPLTDKTTGLRDGDSFAATVHISSPAYLYVVRSGRNLTAQLFPLDAKAGSPMRAGQVRLPEKGTWLRVPPIDPTDLLCVVINAQPLLPEDLTCQTERGDERPPPSPPPPPKDRASPPPTPPVHDTRQPDPPYVLQLPLLRG